MSRAVSIPDELFHYTTHHGLLGIFNSRTVHATSIRHLNDRTEFRHGLKLLREEIAQRLSGQLSDPERLLLLSVEGTADLLDKVPIFVFCMSEESDMLSQWHAYGGSDRGYAIGFNANTLRRKIERHGFHLSRCLYSTTEKRSLIADSIDSVLSIAPDVSQEDGKLTTVVGDLADFLLDHFTKNAAALKDPAFREEKEWRIVSRPIGVKDRRVGFRAGEKTVVPYVDLEIENELRELPISSVTIGPTVHREMAELSLRYLLSHHDVEATVHVSDAPLRRS